MGLGDICRSFCVFWCVVVVWERLQTPPPSLGLGALVYRVFLESMFILTGRSALLLKIAA